MIAKVEQRRAEIVALCVRHRAKRLELFGSAVSSERFNEKSDMDFLVEFLPLGPGEHADAYFGLKEALEELFQRPVDLVMIRAVKNRYFLEAIEKQREVLYAA
ncbi:MAG: hypothetical protein A3K19_22320 [Lentisphaerae bacterium RIFOXYB12_FULL_65_16]|nr:MAG: hypothetical protein A3K18_25665 [Lentisphaerae bacterium RIFOXYA12_64_32]OGV91948.1 MAG: hypothetical protein A3K19_22320 [Lentisphaerae bacterium RIFOXYB12_FULL_65_16]